MTLNQNRPVLELWTDGSTWPGNPGFGGWAAILRFAGKEDNLKKHVLTGYVYKATNNNMETRAVLEGLKAVKHPSVVYLYTDSMYVIRGLRALHYKRLLETNPDLWVQMQPLYEIHTIIARHVKGHEGIVYNEWANGLAGEAVRSQNGNPLSVKEIVVVDEYVEAVPEAYTRPKRKRKKK